MKLIRYCAPLLILVISCHFTLAQADSATWTRVQTDNGEFSADVPENNSYFFDATGFSVSETGNDYALRDVSLLTAYINGTLVSFEVYRTDPDAMKPLLETASSRGETVDTTKLNGSIQAKQLIRQADTHHFISYYFRSKDFVYVVAAASRNGETPEMKRFFDSIKFVPGSKDAAADAIALSKLKRVTVDVSTADVAPVSTPSSSSKTVKPNPDPNDEAIVVISRPRASYTPQARRAHVQGAVRLRVHFGPNGFISKIETIKALPEGLTRQAVFSALRLKYLPKTTFGYPVMATKTIEYTFSIY